MDVNSDLIPGRFYWLTFLDGSRVKVEVDIDFRGDIDARNDVVDFLLWLGRVGSPINRDHLTAIEAV